MTIQRRTLLTGTAAMLAMPAIARAQAGKSYKIGAAVYGLKAEFMQLWVGAIKAHPAVRSGQAAITVFDGQYDALTQSNQFDSMITQRFDAIIFVPIDAQAGADAVAKAKAANIPVIGSNTRVTGNDLTSYVGSDDVKAGTMEAEAVVKAMNGKGNVVVFNIPSQSNLQDRLHGYQSAFEHTDIKITQTVDMNGSGDTAFDNAKKLVDSKAKIDAFICLEAIACPAVADVVNRANMAGKVVVLAMDTDPSTIDWINKGVISATITQKPYTMAYYGTKLLDDLHHHPPSPLAGEWSKNIFSPVPTFVDTGAFVVDKTNVGSLAKSAAPGQ